MIKIFPSLFLMLLLSGQCCLAADKPVATSEWLTINHEPVFWDEYYFWLKYSLRFYREQHPRMSTQQPVIDWSASYHQKPLDQYLKGQSEEYACEQIAIRKHAAALDITFTEADQQKQQMERDKNIRTYGGEMEYLGILKRMYVSESVYQNLTRTDALSGRLFDYLYGVEGRNVSDQVVADYIQQRQLLHVGYLQVQKSLDPVQREAAKNRIDDAREQVLANAKPVASLLKMAREVGDDGIMKRYPQGRLVAAAALPEEVARAYQTLNDNQISDVIETPDGWYLLVRLPLMATTRVNNGSHPLRYWAAYHQLFRPAVARWCAALPVEYASGYQDLKLADVFPAGGMVMPGQR
jgi:hypothetical protein